MAMRYVHDETTAQNSFSPASIHAAVKAVSAQPKDKMRMGCTSVSKGKDLIQQASRECVYLSSLCWCTRERRQQLVRIQIINTHISAAGQQRIQRPGLLLSTHERSRRDA